MEWIGRLGGREGHKTPESSLIARPPYDIRIMAIKPVEGAAYGAEREGGALNLPHRGGGGEATLFRVERF